MPNIFEIKEDLEDEVIDKVDHQKKKLVLTDFWDISFDVKIMKCILNETQLEELGKRIGTINNFIEQL